MKSISDQKALEAFVYNNPDLERLEALLDDFNPFVALQWTRQELRHSAFLAWILDPSETHGLGDYFLRSFLKQAVYDVDFDEFGGPNVFDLDTWDLSESLVTREWNNIDVLVRNEKVGLIVAVENKIGANEHSNQLSRYHQLVEARFPDCRRLYIYLTPGRDLPSDQSWVPFGHGDVADLVRQTLERRGEQLPEEVRAFLGHYVEMVRRHIVEDSEIQTICQRIYERHRRALDILFEHRPDQQKEIYGHLLKRIEETPGLLGDHSTKSYVRFLPESLDFLPRDAKGWTDSGRILLFEFDLGGENVALKLVLGPASSEIREAMRDTVQAHPKLFNRHDKKFYPKYWSFHLERWISRKVYAEGDLEEIRSALDDKFDRLVNQDLPRFVDALEKVDLPAE